ncbi:CMGC/GSK protein kinase [Aphelenchoides fujianensis]|nr:CMGC/GSK protein kinase [Aphelenchoides fujianensis]
MAQPTIHEYEALEMPAQRRVQVKMCKLRLHSSGVFSNVYRGTLLEPAPHREIAVKKTWPDGGQDAHKNYEALGSPNQAEEQAMRAFTHLEGAPVAPRGLNHLLPHCPRESIEFVQRILVYAPTKRLHGSALLTDGYFSDLFVPNKKRLNGRLVADIPSFKEMIDFGPKLHARRHKTKHATKSAETAAPKTAEATRALSQEQAVAKRAKSKDAISKAGASREGPPPSTTTTTLTLEGKAPSREPLASQESAVQPSKETLKTAVKKQG